MRAYIQNLDNFSFLRVVHGASRLSEMLAQVPLQGSEKGGDWTHICARVITSAESSI